MSTHPLALPMRVAVAGAGSASTAALRIVSGRPPIVPPWGADS